MSSRRLRAAAAAVGAAILLAVPAAAAGVYTVRLGDTLSRLAARELGSGGAWPSILLATNVRLGEGLGLGPDPVFRDWFLSQYYESYGRAQPTRYPWTSLGYTFDWGSEVSEEGESEFVIPRGSEVVVESITPTAEYRAE